MWEQGEGKGEEKEGIEVQQLGGQRYKKGGYLKMSGLYRKEQPRRVQGGDGICLPYPVTGRD